MKSNLEYYRHEVNSDDHWKFKMLRVLFTQTFNMDGWGGEGRFWALNNRIAKSENCHLDYTDEIKKLSDAGDLGFSLEQFNLFLDILINKCKLVKVASDGTLFTDHTQMVFSSVQEDREKARIRKNGSRTQTTPKKNDHPEFGGTFNVSQDGSGGKQESSGGKQESTPVTDIESKVKYSKVKNTIPERGSGGDEINGSKPSDFATSMRPGKNPAPRPKKSAPGVEPFQEMYVFEFLAAWRKVRQTEKKFLFQPKDYKAIKDFSKLIRNDHDGEWVLEVAREKFIEFMELAKNDTFISKNNFENFTLPFFINRFNSIHSNNQNGKGSQSTKGNKRSPGRDLDFDAV